MSRLIDFIKDIAKSKRAVVGLVILGVVLVTAILGPLIVPYTPTEQNFAKLAVPSFSHPMGTDDLGRDVFSRVLSGSRLSLLIGVLAVTAAFIVGLLAGCISGYLGGYIDAFIMRIVDVFLAFPYVLGAIALMVVLGAGLFNIVIAIAAFMWASFARLQRASVLEIREVEYVQAARLSGASHTHIIWRHIIPNSISPLIVFGAMSVGIAILGEAVLSFIQVGLQPPTPSLGLMLGDALTYIESAPWTMFFPGLFLALIVFSFIFIADGLRDLLDPLTVDR